MNYRNKLFSVKDPYDIKNTETLFTKALAENCLFQYSHCKEYTCILNGLNFDPESFCNIPDFYTALPFIPTLLFKRRKMFSLPERKLLIKATSSGTSGVNVSEIGFDFGSLLCGLKMVLTVGKKHRLFSLKPCHYIIMGYKPHRSNRTAVTKTAYGATLFTPALSRTYILKYKNGKYFPDFEGVINAVKKGEGAKLPYRFMGFPAYTYFLLKIMDEKGIQVKLPKGSKIFLAGGWKQFYAQKADKKELYALAEKVLGIGEDNITEFFGAVEHPVLYCTCKNHHFHVPIYSRVIIRDADTLKPVKNGTVGLVNLITPMVKGTPVLSVMTDDLGILHEGSECGCGIDTPYLEIIGRVAPDNIKTCAAGAEEIIKNLDI